VPSRAIRGQLWDRAADVAGGSPAVIANSSGD
jgi:hypothetical protein